MSTKPKPVRANNSHDRTLDKYIKDEVQAQKRGAAFTKQMQRVVDKCADDLAVIIAHERATRRPDKDPGIWAVVGKVSDLSLAYTMVVAGLHAGLRSFKPARKFKYKPTAQKWYHYVGLELGFEKDEPALVAGMWASKLLTQLPPFSLTDEGMMEVRLDLPEVQELVRGTINYLVTRKPQPPGRNFTFLLYW